LPVNGTVIATKADFEKRQQIVSTTIETTDTMLQVELYDNAEIDGDTMSLFLNKELILYRQGLTAKPFTVYIKIDTTKDNELSMFAENLGSISPNTALMYLIDGSNRYEIRLSSTKETNGTIIIKKKKDIDGTKPRR
jgi:hypothetical protein